MPGSAAFLQGNRYRQLRNTIRILYDDAFLTDLFPQRGQPAQAPLVVTLVKLMQFADSLSDQQAADAFRARIDWKYSFYFELTDAGFDSSILSEFRQRLLTGHAEERLLNHLLMCCQEHKWLKAATNRL